MEDRWEGFFSDSMLYTTVTVRERVCGSGVQKARVGDAVQVR